MKSTDSSKMMVVAVLSAVFLMISISGLAGCSRSGEAPGAHTQYHCPMHPTYISDKPGDCPICGMRLVQFLSGPPKAKQQASDRYTCPMHPQVISGKPGKCPICGMDLVRAKPEKTEASESGTAEKEKTGRRVLFYRNPMNPQITSRTPAKDEMGMDYIPVYSDEKAPDAGVAGLSAVRIDSEDMRQAGIQTARSERGRLSRSIRTFGTVVPDETRIRRINTKISGWIDRLFVKFTGSRVKRGEPVLAIYSPELLSSQQEYVQALETLKDISGDEAREGSEAIIRSARRRLELFDVPESFIASLEKTRRPQRTVTLLSPADGFVIAKSIFEGQRVEAGAELFTIVDLSRVWVEAAVYSDEAPFIRKGQKAEIIIPYESGSTLIGTVAYIDPVLDPDSRTVRVRFDIGNGSLKLKPGMFCDVVFGVEPVEGIIIPDSSVIDTGTRKIVYVETAPGEFTPREVKTGLRANGRLLVTSGLNAGEAVAVRGNFLLDSESRIRGAAVPADAGGGQ